MRVLYIINAFSWGGAEKLVYDLALAIRDKVNAVSIVGLYEKNDYTEKSMIETLRTHGINTLIIGKKEGSGRINGILKICRFAKEQQCTIIHAHCSVPMLFGKIVGKLLRLPVVCTIHNTRGYSAKRERLTSWMVKDYISIGKAAEKYMIEELGINHSKITRIYNAIDTGAFCNVIQDEDFWMQYGGHDNETVILNVSRVNEQKNQICLLRAVKKVIDRGMSVHAYILGAYTEDDETYQKLKDYVQKENLENNVTFLGMHNNVCDFLANADCFVMTSWYEGLSVAFLEAVISGIPVITTDMPFVRELMELGECATIIDQDDDTSLAEIIMNKNWKQIELNVIERFISMFSLSKFVDDHLKIYEKQIVGSSGWIFTSGSESKNS